LAAKSSDAKLSWSIRALPESIILVCHDHQVVQRFPKKGVNEADRMGYEVETDKTETRLERLAMRRAKLRINSELCKFQK
jgi:hypothetical protein